MLLYQRNYEEALSCFESALRIKRDADPLINLGLLKLYYGRYPLALFPNPKDLELAIRSFEEALKLASGRIVTSYGNSVNSKANLYNYIGITNIGLQRFDVALECFQKAIDIDPSFTLPSHNKELISNKGKKQL